MKKAILFIAVMICFSFTSPKPPIACNAYAGKFIEAANTSSTEIQFCDINPGNTRTIYLHMKETNSDSIAFAVGTAVTSSYGKFGPGQNAIFTIVNGYQNLYYKADVADDEFTPMH